jgi:hypothetical protein
VKDIAAPSPLRRHSPFFVAVIAAVVIALPACTPSPSSTGSGGSSNSGGSTDSPSAVANSACIRSHGVPNFPDPDSSGQFPKTSAQLLGVSSSQLQSAEQACQHLYPNNGSFQQRKDRCFSTGDCPQSVVQQILTAARRFADCMRSQGVRSWPDPTLDSQGRPVFAVSHAGVDPHSPPIPDKEVECDRLTGGAVTM